MSRLAMTRARPAATTAESPAITVEGLTKSYGAVQVLRGLDLVVPTGSITAVLGSSGSGKTTLLRSIAGFETADDGRISLAGRVIDDGRRAVRPQNRGIGYVPQDGALFPHLTVRGNIAFGLHRRHRRQAAGLEELVGLGGLSRRYPHQLSGGQQQRVALARALAIKPAVVLLDEPFGSLDVHLRAGLRAEVLAILRAANATTVLVTHDQDEALSVADHLAVIEAGRLLAHGRPRDLYERPPNPRVATAIGTANILPGRLHAGRVQCAVGEFGVGQFGVGQFGVAPPPGEHSTECLVMVRPENLHLSATGTAGAPSATVTGLAYHGHDTMIDLRLNAPGSTTLVARMSTPPPALGATVALATTGLPHIWVPGT